MGDLTDREVIDVTAVDHQQLIESQIARLKLLFKGADQLNQIDRIEFEIGDQLGIRIDRHIEVPVVGKLTQDRDDLTLDIVRLHGLRVHSRRNQSNS